MDGRVDDDASSVAVGVAAGDSDWGSSASRGVSADGRNQKDMGTKMGRLDDYGKISE